MDGVQTAMDSTKWEFSRIQGNGRVVLGRRFTDDDDNYATTDVDEILFFNQSLSDDQISELYNLY